MLGVASSPILHKPKPVRSRGTEGRQQPQVLEHIQVSTFAEADSDWQRQSRPFPNTLLSPLANSTHPSLEPLLNLGSMSDDEARLRELACIERELNSCRPLNVVNSRSLDHLHSPNAAHEESRASVGLKRCCEPAIPKRPSNAMIRDPGFVDSARVPQGKLQGEEKGSAQTQQGNGFRLWQRTATFEGSFPETVQ